MFAKVVISKVSGPLMHISHKIKHKTFSRLPDFAQAFLKDVKATLERYSGEAKKASMGRGGFTFDSAELRKRLRRSEQAIKMVDSMLKCQQEAGVDMRPPKKEQKPMAPVGIDMRPPKKKSKAMAPFRVGAQPPQKKSKR